MGGKLITCGKCGGRYNSNHKECPVCKRKYPEGVLYDLKERAKGGAKHRNLVDHLQASHHNGYDQSEDGTMIVAYFHNCHIIISPYHNIKMYREVN